MKTSVTNRLTALFIAAAALISLTSCSNPSSSDGKSAPLVVASDALTGVFSPFFTDYLPDENIVSLVCLNLAVFDRSGLLVQNAATGETREYNGTEYTYNGAADISHSYDPVSDKTVYTVALKRGMKFSDGSDVTADDLIFTYYTLLDPSYTGIYTLSSYPIVGLLNYKLDNELAETVTVTDDEISALLSSPDEEFSAVLSDFVRGLLDGERQWANSAYSDPSWKEYTDMYPVAKDLLYFFYGLDSEFDSTAADEDTVFEKLVSDYGADYTSFAAAYAGDETYFDADVRALAKDCITKRKLGESSNPVANISGLVKKDDYTVELTLYGYNASAINALFDIYVSPMHYYGDKALYDYDNNSFGFTKGDLSKVLSLKSSPLGAGPYSFVSYSDKSVSLKANEHYYKGEPNIEYVNVAEISASDAISGISSGAADIALIGGSSEQLKAIEKYNAETEVIKTYASDYLGYGYVGINARTVFVGSDPSSEQSKYLRRALATVIAAYREVAVDSYFGGSAYVIEYPVSSSSWAAPRVTDDGYASAYSSDINGNPLYSSAMTSDERYAAALSAATEYLKAAGFVYDDAAGKFISAPEGSSLSFVFSVPSGGTGAHPAYYLYTDVSAALSSIGITLTLDDPTDVSVMHETVQSGAQQIWALAWDAESDPDIYQLYNSSNLAELGGTNYYGITSAELDGMIDDARSSDDNEYRKLIYKNCFDIVLDWGVDIPFYQRLNYTVVSAQRIDPESLTKDITAFWGYTSEIEQLKLK